MSCCGGGLGSCGCGGPCCSKGMAGVLTPEDLVRGEAFAQRHGQMSGLSGIGDVVSGLVDYATQHPVRVGLAVLAAVVLTKRGRRSRRRSSRR